MDEPATSFTPEPQPERRAFPHVTVVPPEQIQTEYDALRPEFVGKEQMERPHPNFWWSLLWCIVFLLGTQIPGAIVIGVIFVALIFASGNAADLQTKQGVVDSWAMQIASMYGFLFTELLVIGVALGMLLVAMGKEFPRKIALRLPSVTHLVLALLIFPSLVILSEGVYVVIKMIVPDIFGSLGFGDMEAALKLFANWPLPVAILIIGLGPGIGEELFCRGFLGRGLVGNYGYIAGVAMTSFFFGFIHLEPRQALVAMFMGLILHFTYLTTRSLLIPMLLHFMNNSFAVIASHIAALESLDNPGQPPILLYVSALALFAAVAWTLYRCRARLVAPPGEADFWTPGFSGVELPPSWSLTTISHPWPKWYEMGLIVLTFGGVIFAFMLTA